MTENDEQHPTDAAEPRPVDLAPREDGDDEDSITAQVEQPAKVMRIGTMIKQLLEEVRAAPLDEAGRARLREIHESSIRELEDGLAPELREELERLTIPFGGWSAGWRGSSTASRPRSSPSRWLPGPSWRTCGAARCPEVGAVTAPPRSSSAPAGR